MKIIFSTPHADFELNWTFDQSLKNICMANKIPFQSVSFYGKQESVWVLLVGIHQLLSEYVGVYEEIIIKPDRNINYNELINKNIKLKKSAESSSEYTFSSINGNELHHIELNQTDCQNFTKRKVQEFLVNDVTIRDNDHILLGVSGGGDSNALMMSFLESGLIKPQQLTAVMMLGIPDWDKGINRAKELCDSYGIKLVFVDSAEVNSLLGRNSKGDWVQDFEKFFPDADLEVLGTLCIRLALKNVALKHNARAVVTGLNLEDILAECFLATFQGKLPPPFPVRPVDGLAFWHPLYSVPKKIIDGCFPKYSLANYNDRFPSKMLGRAIPYYVAQSLHGIVPGTEFDALNGFKKLAQLNPSYGFYDDDLGFSTVEKIDMGLKSKWKEFIECP